MSEKYYYKIVRINFLNKLCSMNYAIAEDLQIEYKIGEEAKAKVGKIFIFKTLKSARKYIENAPSNFEILKVRAKNVAELPFCSGWISKGIKKFWYDYNYCSRRLYYYKCRANYVYTPAGTMGADSIVPIEFVGRQK